ncbi:MAG: prephenate dehydrogenase [Clostridium sp.]|uniref:prephenate dehydrogenase n=1 Tax=Clostridium sp. TaxID=1506 RepID=UPI0025BB9857|nr:prephenate dehydrogenase [Clostridium sp.]MCH3964934.1 prephenate dehydrogenase [Clostridium sp.]MCI1716572.1 prephenate dehydrogenase [Clostridium sp.]MCI1800946.1 prephenate dehydrogenase [Clostridium sp.]MCI1814749.1 prephenate dehydrogenase [Clostridium sp.]MCI1871693.1 prephenate dehydrogenase [Clostridium sp.]
MEDCDFSNFSIAVVGMGLIGGSYAMALKSIGTKYIAGMDRSLETLDKAIDMKIIDRGYDKPGKFLKDMDIVIVALYPQDTISFIRDNVEYFKPGAIITDTSGIKKLVVEAVDSFLPEDIEFISGHPMAGKEYRGIEYADGSIFKGANYIITPGIRNKKSSIDIIVSMARKFGCKNVEYISPEEHDSIIAYTSQLPHVIATALLMNEHIKDIKPELFVGGSFRDATRVALINSKLWTELFMLNSDELVKRIDEFQSSINRIKKDIKNKDIEDLQTVFEDTISLRKKIN